MKKLFYFLHSARRVANSLNAKVNDLQQENAALMAQNAVLKQQLAEVNNHFNTALGIISDTKQAQNVG